MNQPSTLFAPESCHRHIMATHKPALAWRPGLDEVKWRAELAAKLDQLLGWQPEACPIDVQIEGRESADGYTLTRFTYQAEVAARVVAHLLKPQGVANPAVMICLQGHTSGAHISLGKPKSEKDVASIEGGRDFAIQAVRQGYAALVIEQRCFGERADCRHEPPPSGDSACKHASMVSLLLGRSMQGERVLDVRRGIDALGAFDGLDLSRIACMGNSGGGTVTWYAAATEPRIAALMPSCSICTYADSIASINHCTDNYLPGALRWFEMGDLAGLIAPKPMLVVAGAHDEIFPIAAVRQNFVTIRNIYQSRHAADRCHLVVGEGGHRFYPDLAWPAFRQLTGW